MAKLRFICRCYDNISLCCIFVELFDNFQKSKLLQTLIALPHFLGRAPVFLWRLNSYREATSNKRLNKAEKSWLEREAKTLKNSDNVNKIASKNPEKIT